MVNKFNESFKCSECDCYNLKIIVEKEIKLESIENHGCNDKIEEFIVVQNAGLDSEEIYYTGFSEIEAYRTYKRIKGGKKNIFKAYIKRDLVFNVPFIDTYEIIEVIR